MQIGNVVDLTLEDDEEMEVSVVDLTLEDDEEVEVIDLCAD
jgi:hypothetical protein